MSQRYLVIITHRHSSLRYLYVASGEEKIRVMLDAWKQFQEDYPVRDEDWALDAVEIPEEAICVRLTYIN